MMLLSHIGKTLCLSLAFVIACFAFEIKFASSTSGRGSRIAGGTEAARNQFPFAVIFFISSVEDDQSICSGAIISNTWVLSAGIKIKLSLYFSEFENFQRIVLLKCTPPTY